MHYESVGAALAGSTNQTYLKNIVAQYLSDAAATAVSSLSIPSINLT